MANKPEEKKPEVRDTVIMGSAAAAQPSPAQPTSQAGPADVQRPPPDHPEKAALLAKLADAEKSVAALQQDAARFGELRNSYENEIGDLHAQLRRAERELGRKPRRAGVFHAKVTLVLPSHDETSARREVQAGEVFEASAADLAGLTEGVHFE